MEKGRGERFCGAWRWEVLEKGREPFWVPQSLGADRVRGEEARGGGGEGLDTGWPGN